MDYMPRIESAKQVAAVTLRPGLTIILFDNIKSAGSIQYAYLVGVFDDEGDKPVYFVASEVNTMAISLGGGSHFLGSFPGDGHLNHGDSDDWADPRKFFPKALDMVHEHFGMTPPSQAADADASTL